MTAKKPQVGIGVFLVKDGLILLGRRKGSHGHGEYALPGGHLELGETFEECALRELAEEAGPDIKVKSVRFLCLTNMRRYAPKHYADIGITAEWSAGKPRVMEPEKKEDWQWYDLNDLPQPLFGCTDNYIEAYRTGKTYFLD
jgi:8-oxo-dGTP diphosphatase